MSNRIFRVKKPKSKIEKVHNDMKSQLYQDSCLRKKVEKRRKKNKNKKTHK